jgi:hypothetical protein
MGAVGVASVACFMAPASAATVSPHATVAAGIHAAASKPNSNLSGTKAAWKPTKLTAAPTTGTCSKTNYSFTITNDTTKSQVIQYKSGTGKKTLGTLKAKEKAGVCLTGTKGEEGILYAKSSGAALTVTLS